MHISIFTVGVALIHGNSFAQGFALTDYSYINAKSDPNFIHVLARCLTGLGPSGTDNGHLGGLFFNSNRLPNSANCWMSGRRIFPEPGTITAGAINIQQCGLFTTAVEGVYTCVIKNSSMIDESVRFGVYFNGRSESLNAYIPSLNHVSSL